jgi:hypothetical protein
MLILLFLKRSLRIGLKVRPLNLDFIFEVIFYLRKNLFQDLGKLIMYVLGRLVMLLYFEPMPVCCLL